MTNELIIPEGISDEEFNAKLNEATGYRSNILTPAIKFNAEEGNFYKTEGEKDEDGKPKYDLIEADHIDVHIIKARKMVSTKLDAKKQLYSREFDGDFVELFDENNELSVSGTYKALKSTNDNLVFIQVLYLYLDGKPYRMKLSGSKLSNFFEYSKTANPALYKTRISKGNMLKNEKVNKTYYELNFEALTREEVKIITSRVNAVNSYIRSYEGSRDKRTEQTQEIIPADEPPMISEDDICLANVPF